jgi:hypothetical protein
MPPSISGHAAANELVRALRSVKQEISRYERPHKFNNEGAQPHP